MPGLPFYGKPGFLRSGIPPEGALTLNRRFFILLSITGFIFILAFVPVICARADEKLVIVIDPGHGGDNLGALYEEYTEKEMNLVVARAMQEELLKYEQVEVYLTREGDTNISIKDRAAFAAEKNADFLFCLHFNTSEERNYFGAEVWVPAAGEYYAKGYSFAQIEMQELTGIGLYSRGIKTRLNNLGMDYYGILRYCTAKKIPSALIEHCHLDHEKDQGFYQEGEEQLREFGRLDARAVAKYLGLSSKILGVDYSDHPVPQTDIPSETVAPDRTGPELCRIETAEIREDTGEITVHIEAEDPDSYILYYGYSIDGGRTWSPLEEWPRPDQWDHSSREHEFSITVPFDQELQLMARVYNGFDLYTESDRLDLPPVPDPQRLKEEAKKDYVEIHYEEEVISSSEDTAEDSFLQIAIIIGLLLLLMFLLTLVMAKMIISLIKGNKRR